MPRVYPRSWARALRTGFIVTLPNAPMISEDRLAEIAAAVAPGRILCVARPKLTSHRLVCIYALPLCQRLQETVEEAFAAAAQAQKKSGRSVADVDLFEARMFCLLVLKRNPRLLSVLLADATDGACWGSLQYESGPWPRLRQSCSAADFGGAVLARSCAHQAHGRAKRLRAKLPRARCSASSAAAATAAKHARLTATAAAGTTGRRPRWRWRN